MAVHGSARHPQAATQVCVWVKKHHGKGFCPCYMGKELAVRHPPTYCLRPFVLTWLCSKNSTNRPSSWRPELLAGKSGVWISELCVFCLPLPAPNTQTCLPVLSQPMKQTCEYCTVQNIPFPEYDIQEEGNSNLKECYLMENSREPDAPIVLFFPLISDTFQKYKAPGKLPGSSVPSTTGLGLELLSSDICPLLIALTGSPV